MLDKLKELFEDEGGKLSSLRLIFILSSLVVLFIWTYISWEKKELVKIDNSILIYLGALIAGKMGQNWTETK